jgi:hypothetical protein
MGQRVDGHVKNILGQINANDGGGIFKRFSLSGIVGTLSNFLTSASKSGRQELVERLQQSGAPTDQLGNSILAVMVGASVELTEALTHMVNLLLEDANIGKALAAGAKDDSVLQGYVSEVLRINPPTRGVYRQAKANETVGALSVKQGNVVYLNISNAHRNERAFVNPGTFNPSRSQDNRLKGDILTRTLGTALLSKIMIQVLRAIVELKNVRRGPGESGALKQFSVTLDGIPSHRYINQTQNFTQWAQSMVIQYDAEQTTA